MAVPPMAQSGQGQPTPNVLAPAQTMAGGEAPPPASASLTAEASLTPAPALPSATHLPFPSPSPTFDPYPLPYIYPTAPPVPPPPIASAWLTYTHNSGVQLRYPDDWLIETTIFQSESYPFVAFIAPRQDRDAVHFCAMLDVYDLPLADRFMADPYYWERQHEPSIQILWNQPMMSQDNLEGLLYLQGNYVKDQGGWIWGPYLEAIYYDERHELDIRLRSCVDYESVALFETLSYEEVIATRFAVFEQMVRSVRVVRPPPP